MCIYDSYSYLIGPWLNEEVYHQDLKFHAQRSLITTNILTLLVQFIATARSENKLERQNLLRRG
jgi:hypothetical protein